MRGSGLQLNFAGNLMPGEAVIGIIHEKRSSPLGLLRGKLFQEYVINLT